MIYDIPTLQGVWVHITCYIAFVCHHHTHTKLYDTLYHSTSSYVTGYIAFYMLYDITCRAWALVKSLTRPSLFLYFREIRNKLSHWPGSQSAPRLYNHYNLYLCAMPRALTGSVPRKMAHGQQRNSAPIRNRTYVARHSATSLNH